MSRKGQKNLKGRPELWNELKARYNLTLTPTGVEGLDAIAVGLGLSRSELVERIGRGLIPLQTPPPLATEDKKSLGKRWAS